MHRSKLPLTTWFWAVISAVSDASIPQRLPSCYGRLVAAQRVREPVPLLPLVSRTLRPKSQRGR